MDHYGLLGFPLGHSFSAKFFADKFAEEHIDADYRNFEFETVEEALRLMQGIDNLRGFNVTIPHKQNILPHLVSLSPEAAAIGAVNVVRVERSETGEVRLHGFNSDLVGFRESVRPLLRPEIHRNALVLGTGGASKAVVHGLRQLGITPLSVSRRPADGRITYADLTAEVMQQNLVVVNCTPLGMHPKTEGCPDIPYAMLTPQHVLFDLVYNPAETTFMKRGREQGATVKNGLEMLHLQAEEAWRIWQ